MAKRLVDWNEIEKMVMAGEVEELHTFLIMSKYTDADTPADELAGFDINRLYPGFTKFNAVQKFIIVYGVKQKLSDHNNTEKDLIVRAKSLVAKYQDFIDNKLIGERSNSTGAKADKKLAGSLKAVCSVVSLEGLQAKKIFFPDTFTEEDQAKLDEFEEMVFQHMLAERKKNRK